jgi:hypothetical protein
MNREQKLLKAKEKLNNFQKKRSDGYSLQQTLSSTTINGQPLQGLGLASSTQNINDNGSTKSLSSLYTRPIFMSKTPSQSMDVVVQDLGKLGLKNPRYCCC